MNRLLQSRKRPIDTPVVCRVGRGNNVTPPAGVIIVCSTAGTWDTTTWTRQLTFTLTLAIPSIPPNAQVFIQVRHAQPPLNVPMQNNTTRPFLYGQAKKYPVTIVDLVYLNHAIGTVLLLCPTYPF